MKNLFSIAAIFAAAFAAVPARLPGATYYAAPSSQGDGSGSSSGNACTLKEAVSKVNADAGGEIVLAPGVYQEDASDTGTGNYLNNKWTYSYYVLGASGQNYPIVVRSASGDPSDTIVKGQYCDNEKYIRLFLAFGNAVRISGLTLCEGAVELSSSAHGGGAVLGIRDTEGGGARRELHS